MEINLNNENLLDFVLFDDYTFEYTDNNENYIFKCDFDIKAVIVPLDNYDFKIRIKFKNNNTVQDFFVDVLGNSRYNLETESFLFTYQNKFNISNLIEYVTLIANISEDKRVDFIKDLYDITLTESEASQISYTEYEEKFEVLADTRKFKGRQRKVFAPYVYEEKQQKVNLPPPVNNLEKKIQDYYLTKKEDKSLFSSLVLSRNYENRGLDGYVKFDVTSFKNSLLQYKLEFLRSYTPSFTYLFVFRYVDNSGKPIDYEEMPVETRVITGTNQASLTSMIKFTHKQVAQNSYNLQYGIKIKVNNSNLVNAINKDLKDLNNINIIEIFEEGSKSLAKINSIIDVYSLDSEYLSFFDYYTNSFASSQQEINSFIAENYEVVETLNYLKKDLQDIYDLVKENTIIEYSNWFSNIYKNNLRFDTGFKIFKGTLNQSFRETRNKLYNTLKFSLSESQSEDTYLLANDIIIENRAIDGSFFDPKRIYKFNREKNNNFSSIGLLSDSLSFDNNIYSTNTTTDSDKKRIEDFLLQSKDYVKYQNLIDNNAEVPQVIGGIINKNSVLIDSIKQDIVPLIDSINEIKLKEVYLTNLYELHIVSSDMVSTRKVTLNQAKQIISDNLQRLNSPTLFKLVKYGNISSNIDLIPNDLLSMPIFDEYFLIESQESTQDPQVTVLPPTLQNFDNTLSKPEIIQIPVSQFLAGSTQKATYGGEVTNRLNQLNNAIDNFNGTNGLADAKQKLDSVLAGNFGTPTPTPPKTNFGDINPVPNIIPDQTRFTGVASPATSVGNTTPPRSGPIDKTARPVNLGSNQTANQKTDKRTVMNVKKADNSNDNKFKVLG